jgi:phosphoribosylaminoimidazolecarboxamide formyltransferase/IMP cyclohydrolase
MGRILASVTDKFGLEKFKQLTDIGWEMISTGGTARRLKECNVPHTLVEDVTGFPEILDGRVKTLHPVIFGGILADQRKESHLDQLQANEIEPIDLVVVNLYNFAAKPGIEEIDIGGPSLLRAAAKNCACVAVVVDPGDYDRVIGQILLHGKVLDHTREELAITVFQHTSAYDGMIAAWMSNERQRGKSFSQAMSTGH